MPKKFYNPLTMSSRKEFLKTMAVCGFSFIPELGTQPSSSEAKRFQPEWEQCFNEQTFWQAKNMPIYLLKTNSSDEILYSLKIDGVDCQMLSPFLGKPRVYFEQSETKTRSGLKRVEAQNIFAVVPTVTGIPAHYVAHAGCLFDQTSSCFSAEALLPGTTLASYLAIGRYYDNKTINAAEAVFSLASNPQGNTIPPQAIFSYINATKIRELEEAKDGRILMGKGLYPSTSKPGESELKEMFAGGICVSAAVIAKMARQAEAKGLTRIVQVNPHGQDKKWWYFMNPDDPTPKQVDATIYWPSNKDLCFQNLTQQTLYLVPKVQIIADPAEKIPTNYNGLDHTTAFFVLSVSLQTTPITPEEVTVLKNQIASFRQLRNI